MSQPEFTTARLWLRHVQPEDLDDLIALDSDPEVMRFISGGKPNTRADYLGQGDQTKPGLLARMTAYSNQDPPNPQGYFSAFMGEARRFVGWFHLRPSVFDPEVPELGYRLSRAVWGQGLASEGSRALVAYAFDTLGVAAVDACALPDNAASIAVMRKFGMRLVGESAHPLAPQLQVVRYLVTREQWAARG